MRRLAGGVVVCLLPVLLALYVGATEFSGSLIPWRATMVDLGVYRTAGRVLLDGGDFYSLPGQLQFLYPPFAAVLAVPLALLPQAVVEIGWTVAGALTLVAVVHRSGLTGWRLALVSSVAVVLAEPVRQTFAFGQLGILLVALVFLDLAPGPRVLPRRLLPVGILTGLATALKLTPAIFVAYLLLTRRFRAFAVATGTFVGISLLSAVVTPAASAQFWGRLAHGDTGLGHSIIYSMNQSVMGDVVRIGGDGPTPPLVGLALSGLVALLGLLAAVLWHRAGDPVLAVNLCGIAGLLASPVSWLHHFIWVVPFALSLARRRTADEQRLPAGLQGLGWAFVTWVMWAPILKLPNGADVEWTYTWPQHLLASVTSLIGVALLVAGVVAARRHQSTRTWSRQRSTTSARPSAARPA